MKQIYLFSLIFTRSPFPVPRSLLLKLIPCLEASAPSRLELVTFPMQFLL